MFRMHSNKIVHPHETQTYTKLMNRNTAQLVLLQDFPLPFCPRFPENQLFQRRFLVTFLFLEDEKQAAFTKIFLGTALSLLCAPLLFLFLFFV